MEIKIDKKSCFLGHQSSVYAISAGKTANQFFSVAGDGWIVEWDTIRPDMGKLIAKTDTNLFSVTFDEKREWILAGDMYGGLHWIDLTNKNNFKSSQFHKKGIFSINKLGDNLLLTLGGEGSIGIWDLEKNQILASVEISNSSLRALVIHPKRSEVAVASSDNSIYILDSKNFKLIHKIENAHHYSVFSLSYSTDGNFLLSGGRDAYLRIWDSNKDYLEIPTEAAHLFTVNAIAFHPEHSVFATASRDKTIKIWSLKNFTLLKVIDNIRYGFHQKSVNALLWLDADTLISCSDDRSIVNWNFSIRKA